MKIIRKPGVTDQTLLVFVQDSSSTTGAGLTGVAHSDVTARYVRVEDDNDVVVSTITMAALSALTDDHSDGGWFEVDSTNLPGWYRWDIPDGAFAAGATEVGISLIDAGSNNIAQLSIEIQLAILPSNLTQILGTTLTETSGQIAAAFKQFFDVSSPTGTMKAITAVGTCTTNTDMRGTDNALLASTWSTFAAGMTTLASWLGAMMGKTADASTLAEIQATTAGAAFDNTTDSMEAMRDHVGDGTNLTEAGGTGNHLTDLGGMSTAMKGEVNAEVDGALNTAIPGSPTADSINERIKSLDDAYTATRGGYLENLNVGGNVASSAEVTSVQNNTRVVRVVPNVIERPDSGTSTYRIELFLYDTNGNMEAPDSAPTIALVDQDGNDLSSRLDSATMSLVSTGRYRAVYTATDTDDLEQLVWAFSVVEGGNTRIYGNTSLIVDTTAVDFTSSDRTTLQSLATQIGTAGDGLTSLPWNSSWDAEVQSECADALGVYDPPTNAEMEARTLVAANYATAANQSSMASSLSTLTNRIGAWTGTGVNTILGAFKALLSKAASIPSDIGGTFDPATDSVEAIRDTEPLGTAMRGTDGANTTTPPTVAAIRTEMDDNSTKLAAIAIDVAGLDGAAMRGTDGANTTTPPTAAAIRAEIDANSTKSGYKLASDGLNSIVPTAPSAKPTIGTDNILSWWAFMSALSVNEFNVDDDSVTVRNTADTADLVVYPVSDDGTTFVNGPAA